MPSIDENIANIPRIRESGAYEEFNSSSFFFMNDTRITSQTMSDDLRRPLSWSAFPVGNWSHINDLFLTPGNNSIFEVQIFDTAAEWGYSLTGLNFGAEETYTYLYSKENGALNVYEHSHKEVARDYIIQITIVGDAIPLIIVIGGVSIGLLVVALVVLKKRV